MSVISALPVTAVTAVVAFDALSIVAFAGDCVQPPNEYPLFIVAEIPTLPSPAM